MFVVQAITYGSVVNELEHKRTILCRLKCMVFPKTNIIYYFINMTFVHYKFQEEIAVGNYWVAACNVFIYLLIYLYLNVREKIESHHILEHLV